MKLPTDEKDGPIPEVPFDEEDTIVPDECMAEIAEINPKLNQQERKYVYWRSIANPPLVAYRKAGYTSSNWRSIESRPKIRETLAELNEKLEPEYRVSQQKVVGMLMEGYELARIRSNPKVMIEAAVALANITGVGAAAKIQIDQKTQVSLQMQQDVKALQHLPRNNLEDMVGVSRSLPYIDAVYEELSGSESVSEREAVG